MTPYRDAKMRMHFRHVDAGIGGPVSKDHVRRKARARRLAELAQRRTDGRPTLVACIPVDTSRLPPGLPPVPVPSIEHTLIQCPRCGEDCWIGPTQNEMANLGHTVLCYYCAATVVRSWDDYDVQVLDPNADNTPRRT